MSCLAFPDTKPNARMDLFCLCHAGGSASVFRQWNDQFPQWVSVRPVEYPGRGARMIDPLEPVPTRLVESLLGDIEPSISRPFAFLGHSMGSVVAYRILLKLAPARKALAFFSAGGRSPLSTDPLPLRAHLDDDDLIEEIRRFGGSPPEVLDNRELMDIILPIIRCDFSLGETLKAEENVPKIDCPIHILGGTKDIEVPPQSLISWQNMTEEMFSITLFKGEHFFIYQPDLFPHVRDRIVDILGRSLSGQLGIPIPKTPAPEAAPEIAKPQRRTA